MSLSQRLVLVTELQSTQVAYILKVLEAENITPEAVYQVTTRGKLGKWGLDYSAIYTDLAISPYKVDKTCLLITTLNANYEEISGLVEGNAMPRSHCSRLPVPTVEHPVLPVIVLIPHLLLSDSGSSTSTLLSLIINSLGHQFDSGSKRIHYKWLERISSFPYKRLWMSSFSLQDQAILRHKFTFPDKCSIFIVKFEHIKANFEVVYHRSKSHLAYI